MTSPKSVQNFLQDGDYLPSFLKDFHDAKDFFKTMHDFYEKSFSEGKDGRMPNWREGHIYTIDFLLYFLAFHGWTLQRSRAKINFGDLQKSISEFKEKQAKQLDEFLKSHREEKTNAANVESRSDSIS